MKPNTKRKGLGLLNAVSIGAALMLAMPIACGDDDDDGSGGRGGRGGTAGRGGSGGKGGDASAGTGGTGGSAGTGGTAGSAGTSGSAGSGGADGGDGSAGTAGTAGDSGTDAGDGGLPACAPGSASTTRLCLHLRPEVITPEGTPDLDGQGQLFVSVFTNSAGSGTPIGQAVWPPPVDGGLPGQVDVDELPMIPIEFNTPAAPATVYVYAVFVDNMAWYANRAGLTYGLFVGGLALAEGVQPRPPLNGIPVTAGQGKNQIMNLTALRKLETRVYRSPLLTSTPGNGQGQLVVGVFKSDDTRGAAAYGGARPGCVNTNTIFPSPPDAGTPNPGYPFNAFFYGSGDFWVGAQVDDYNLMDNPAPGALVSIVLNDAGAERLPPNQKITGVSPTAYSASLPRVVLTGVMPGAPASDTYSCPTPDGGS